MTIEEKNEDFIKQKAIGSGSFILEAPAGSGKTSILTKRFLSLLLQVKRPTEIIALTFTNKAAQEMKNRIRSALNNASKDKDLKNIIDKIKKKANKQNWREDFQAQLRIMTIDKLALQVINQAPILDNSGLNYQTDENPDEIYMQAINESLNESKYASSILDYVENDYRKLSSQLINIIKKRDQWLTDLTFYFEKNLEEIKVEYIKYAKQEQEQISSQIKGELSKDIIHDIRLIMQKISPEIKKIDFQFWFAFSNLVLTKEGYFRKQFDKRQGIPNDEEGKKLKNKIADLLIKLSNKNNILFQLNQVNYCNNFINFLPLIPDLLLLLFDINQRLMTLFTKLKIFDFSQIILNANRILEQTNLALILDEKITHILVDEFQDINYAQLKFIELLTQNFAGDPEKTFFAVGDPMQSIYRFRKAEVGIFKKLQLEQRLGDLQVSPLQLNTNFRSNVKIIEWLNSNICHLFPTKDNIELGSVAFNTSRVGRKDLLGDGVSTHTLIIESDNNDAIYQTEAMYVAKLLQAVKQENPNYKIAVLTRSRSHLNELLTSIKRDYKDLPIQAIEINSVRSNQTFEDIFMLTKALFNFDDKIAWMALLRSPIIGLKNRDLASLFENNHHLNTWSILNDSNLLKNLNEQSLKRLHKLTITINNNIDLRGRVSQRYFIESIWRQLDGDKAMINFEDMHVIDNFLNLVDQSSHSLLSIDFTRLEKLIDETYISDIDSHPNPIQFLTIQKSKGLEYDAVIIPNMNKTIVNESHSLFLMDKKIISMINMAEEPNLYDYHRYKEKERLRSEYSRLLYVAITRAKHECHLITSISKDKIASPSPCNEGSFASLLWPSINKDLIEIKPSSQQNPYNEFIPKLRRLKDHFFEGNLKRNNEIYDGQHEVYINQSFSNLETEIGTILHKILELIVKKQLFIDNLLENSLNYFKDYFTHYRFSKDDTSYAIEQIKIAIHKLKTTKDGQWITNQFEDDLSEIKYSIDDPGQSISLIPDRTFIENNVRWIVDYKFTKNSDLEKVALSYRSQLEGYKKIYEHNRNINLAIYFINHGRLITLN